MSEIHRIKCGNSNCYIIENGTNGILVDTGKKEFFNKVIESCKFYSVKLIVLAWVAVIICGIPLPYLCYTFLFGG